MEVNVSRFQGRMEKSSESLKEEYFFLLILLQIYNLLHLRCVELEIGRLGAGIFFLILAHPVCKM
jgi:hypothetical protein